MDKLLIDSGPFHSSSLCLHSHNFEKAELCRNSGRKWNERDPKETGSQTTLEEP
jgi:hypothetical protein